MKVQLNETSKCIALSLSILLALFGFHRIVLQSKIYPITHKMVEFKEDADRINSKLINNSSINSQIPRSKSNYLVEKFNILKKLKDHHLEVGRIFFANYYTISLDLIVLLSVISILFLTTSNNGLKNTSIYIRVVFYTVLAATAFLTTIIVSFSHQENYSNNFKQYILYDNMQNKILTFLSTSDGINTNNKDSIADSFINRLNNEFIESNSVFLDIDASKINMENMKKIIETK